MEDKKLFIWLLEYGEKHLDRTVTCQEAVQAAYKEKVISNLSVGDGLILRGLFLECFEFPEDKRTLSKTDLFYHNVQDFDGRSGNNSTHLRPEYYFRLLEFRELELARKTAASAKTTSLIANGIAIFALIASVVISAVVARWPITIDHNQIEALKASINSPASDDMLKVLVKISPGEDADQINTKKTKID